MKWAFQYTTIGVPVLKAYHSLYIGTNVFGIFDFWYFLVSQIVANEPQWAQIGTHAPNWIKHAHMYQNLTHFPAGSSVFVFWLTSNFQGPLWKSKISDLFCRICLVAAVWTRCSRPQPSNVNKWRSGIQNRRSGIKSLPILDWHERFGDFWLWGFLSVPNCHRWVQVSPNGHTLVQMKPHGPNWIQI